VFPEDLSNILQNCDPEDLQIVIEKADYNISFAKVGPTNFANQP
jgi:hypothetical protein